MSDGHVGCTWGGISAVEVEALACGRIEGPGQTLGLSTEHMPRCPAGHEHRATAAPGGGLASCPCLLLPPSGSFFFPCSARPCALPALIPCSALQPRCFALQQLRT